MNAILDQPFHAPADTDLVDRLCAERDAQLARLQQLHGFVTGGYSDALMYFLNWDRDARQRYSRSVEQLFDLPQATAYLDATFWRRALDQTDVFECMPQARKDQWQEQIDQRQVPEFTEPNVRATIGDLLLARTQFLAEKADGVFQRLSRTHVTNAPQGFGKRFILDSCFSYGSAHHSAAGYLTDLREIIAKYVGRALPEGRIYSGHAMDFARQHLRGEWLAIDGGALRIRCYLKGTMHVEVHPDIAWRLNLLLHSLHPAAIPASFRAPPKKANTLPPVHDRPLSFEALRVLANGRCYAKTWTGGYGEDNKAALKEAEDVLEQIGGVKKGGGWSFGYDVREVVQEIIASGLVPDRVAHQYYPTPRHIAEAMVQAADLHVGERVLEPSAGTGAILDVLQDWFPGSLDVDCIEISPLHCRVLEAKGYPVEQADFIEWCKAWSSGDREWSGEDRWDAIIMNPPYSRGRAIAHLEAARQLLAPEGRIVALLPATCQNRDLPGRWVETFDRFPGTSIAVGIYVEQYGDE